MCCIQCLNIFHYSCIAKKKSVIQLEAHKVICSKECEKQRKDRENEMEVMTGQFDKLVMELREKKESLLKIEEESEIKIAELYDEIGRLTIENKEKGVFIQRLERRSTDFEDEVLSTEQNYISKIDEQKVRICKLNKEILEFVQKNSALKDECERVRVELDRVKKEVSECNQLRESMLISIETLTEENHVYVSELKNLRCENMNLRDAVREMEECQLNIDESRCDIDVSKADVMCDAEYPTPDKESLVSNQTDLLKDSTGRPLRQGVETVVRNFSRVLILCDENGRDLHTLLKEKLKTCGARFMVETLIKPGASFDRVTEDIKSLTKDYCSMDYVIVVAGSNDFKRNKYPSFRLLVDKVRHCSHTNMVLLSVPYFSKRLNSRIHRYNTRLNELVYRLSQCTEGFVEYVELNVGKSIQSCKRLVSGRLAFLIGSRRSLCKNLIFIKTQGESTSLPDTSESANRLDSQLPLVMTTNMYTSEPANSSNFHPLTMSPTNT